MYNLQLTESEWRDIEFVGYRYQWSSALCHHRHTVDAPFPEHIAWEIRDAFDADTEGGHDMFPMLDPRSELCHKLASFYESIV